VSGIIPNSAGEITVSLAPTSKNNNANHFTYLGAMKVTFSAAPKFTTPQATNNIIILNWSENGKLEHAPTLAGPWKAVFPAPSAPYSELIDFASNRFYRIKQ
jgi:hypothetical protein